MNKRIEAVRDIIKAQNIDGLIISKQHNWQYLSGFSGSNAFLLLTDKENYLITDFRYFQQATEETTDFRIIKPTVLVEDALIEQVISLGLKRVGFEDDITYFNFQTYSKKLSGVELVPLHEAVEKIRWIKDVTEIEAIRKAAEIADLAFDHILGIIQPGKRESDIAAELEFFMKKNGSQKPAFETIIASGARAAMPHGTASDKLLAKGDLVILDFGAVFDGYHSDMTRTVVLGSPDQQQRDIYDLVLKAQKTAVEAVKAGVKCSAVDLVARDMIAVAGYGANFGHGLGHSVGLEIHEKPSFTPRDDTVLEPGMVLTVEPGVYLNNWGGVRIEDLVVVTSTGYEILSKSPQKMIQL